MALLYYHTCHIFHTSVHVACLFCMTKVNIFGHHFHNAEDVQAAVTESFPLIKNDAFELL